MNHRTTLLNVAAWLVAGVFALGLAAGCETGKKDSSKSSNDQKAQQSAKGDSIQAIMKRRGLKEKHVKSALKTYMPTGKKDSHLLVASGGHSGQVMFIGVPSMRLLKITGVFTPEPWQGYGYGDKSTEELIDSGDRFDQNLAWGDTHHPALSETDGTYDGEYLFINDKANPRIGVVSLHDFETKQIVKSELIQSEHGSTFVTPNTEYVIQGAQYPAPLGGDYAPLSEYNESYRGAVIFWKFNREKGEIEPRKSFAMELPPYMQDLSDAGKKASKGWVFLNSFNTERAHGGNMQGNPPLESGASQNDMDYMHMINLQRAAQVAQSSKNTERIAEMPVIPIDKAVSNDLLYFVPEPKSPHGVDVTPDGEELVVSGKLDTHATVYDFKKMRKLMKNETFADTDPYGVPILPFEKSIRGQVELGLGPLHTQFDGNGHAYTSLFIASKIAKWDLEELEVESKESIHYNVGHIATTAGDTTNPSQEYLVSLNKWALDRFANVGPLHPQNFQLFDISGEEMELLYDMPVPIGEPHYAQIIDMDKIDATQTYEVGVDPIEAEKAKHAVSSGEERIERKDGEVHVYMTAIRSHFKPDTIRVEEGKKVHLHVTNIEKSEDATHGFAVGSHNVSLSLEPGEHADVTFVADKPGVWPMYCTEFCSALHLEMAGYILVKPDDEPNPSMDPETSEG
jgi:nitrous-oxide reductase